MPMSADELLEALDPEQRAVATSFGHPVCVLAGAGTGKTRALTYRIGYGIASGEYSPSRVLALTFTTRAAGELKARLAELDASAAQVRTFHSAALAQLNHFWPQVAGGGAPNVLDGKARTIGDAAARLRLKLDVATARDIAALIEWRKVRMLGLADVARDFAEGTRQPPGRLSVDETMTLLEAYETLNGERKQVDFEDVLLLTAGMLMEEPQVADQVREQYRHFVVDEYQDVSPIQQQLLNLWLGERHDICVVGDASQTIYRFAGASAHYLLDFAEHYDDAEVITLERNYRSSPEIVARANDLMRGKPGAITLVAQLPARVEPTVFAYPNDAAEANAVAEQIAQAIASGTSPDDIAVLYRVNAQSEAFERALTERGVGYRVRGGVPFFERPEIRQALMQLRAEALSGTGSRPFFQVVNDVLWSLGWSTEAPTTPGAVRDRWESLNVLAELADAAPKRTTLSAFVDELRTQAEHGTEPALGAVTLATVHSVKGLEWDHVWIVGATEGLIPISYAKTPDAIDEERRLMYVAITRARQALHLSWAKVGARGEQAPSRFLAESNMRSVDAERPIR